MWAIWALAACAGAMPELSASGGEPRPSVPILVISPPGYSSDLRASEVLDAAALLLDRVSSARGLSPEQAGLSLEALDGCAVSERFVCWVRRLGALPFAVRSSGWGMLILRRPTGQGGERLDVQLIEIEGALRALAALPPEAPGEDAVFQHARALPYLSVDGARDAATLAAALEARVAESLATTLPAARHGRVELRAQCAPCDLYLDGRPLGRLEGSELALIHVPAGAHHLTLESGRAARDHAIEVAAGETTTLDLRDFAAPAIDGGLARGWLLGAGTAALVGGVVLVGVASAQSSGLVCLESASGRCPSPGPWAHVPHDPLIAEPRIDPLLLTGAALAGAGLSWGAAGVIDASPEPLWATLLALAGAGVGIAVAAVGGAP